VSVVNKSICIARYRYDLNSLYTALLHTNSVVKTEVHSIINNHKRSSSVSLCFVGLFSVSNQR